MHKGVSTFYWENDFTDMTEIDGPIIRDIDKKPTGKFLKQTAFAHELMDPIVEHITEIQEQSGKIAICGDYDVDGTTATTILMKTLWAIGIETVFEIPDRFIDGYGISKRIIDMFIAKDITTIITVDNGIAAVEEIAYARANGMHVILTDHHHIGENIPDTPFILHPDIDETMEEKAICGAMVAYLLAKALLDKFKVENKTALLQEFQQLACIATLADMMPLRGINRDMTYLGFKLMQENPTAFFTAFQTYAGKTEITSDFISFTMNPTINAIGRLEQSNQIVDAMLLEKVSEIVPMIDRFSMCNAKRKELVQQIFEEVLADFASQNHVAGFFVGVGENWHQGVLGIVAQKLMQKIHLPVILLTTTQDSTGTYTGSARAFSGYNVYDCFHAVENTLIKYGGHQYAGGLTVASEQLAAFKQAVEIYNMELTEQLTDAEKMMHITIDAWRTGKSIDMKFIKEQAKYAPFGEGNKAFIIGIANVRVTSMQELGKTKQHVKLFIEEAGKQFSVVAFGFYHLLEQLAIYNTVDIVIHVQENYFNGQTTVQYSLVDIRVPRQQIFDYRSVKHQARVITEGAKTYIVDSVPMDKTQWLTTIQETEIERIYLTKMPYEDLFVYAFEVPKTAFNFVYKVLSSQPELNLEKESTFQAFYNKKLPKSVVLYIIQVFFELDFVIIDKYICKINVVNEKQQLEASPSYQAMQEWLSLRNTILFEPIDKLYDLLG